MVDLLKLQGNDPMFQGEFAAPEGGAFDQPTPTETGQQPSAGSSGLESMRGALKDIQQMDVEQKGAEKSAEVGASEAAKRLGDISKNRQLANQGLPMVESMIELIKHPDFESGGLVGSETAIKLQRWLSDIPGMGDISTSIAGDVSLKGEFNRLSGTELKKIPLGQVTTGSLQQKEMETFGNTPEAFKTEEENIAALAQLKASMERLVKAAEILDQVQLDLGSDASAQQVETEFNRRWGPIRDNFESVLERQDQIVEGIIEERTQNRLLNITPKERRNIEKTANDEMKNVDPKPQKLFDNESKIWLHWDGKQYKIGTGNASEEGKK